jgi:hypothetical protein
MLTEVDAELDGDRHFPAVPVDTYQEVGEPAEFKKDAVAENDYNFVIKTFRHILA